MTQPSATLSMSCSDRDRERERENDNDNDNDILYHETEVSKGIMTADIAFISEIE